MKRQLRILIAAMVAIVSLSGMATAAPSFLGTTGNILTPNDRLVGPGELGANFHILQLANDVQVIGATIGVTESLELGIARFDPRAAGAGVDTVLSGKYLVMPETAARPSVVVGVVDASGGIASDDNPSAYVVLGKNLTPMATGWTGQPVQPLKGYLGFGTGIYDGIFAAAELGLGPTATVMAEYISGLGIRSAIDETSVFNFGVRFDLTDDIRADAALINGNDFAFGVSYRGASF